MNTPTVSGHMTQSWFREAAECVHEWNQFQMLEHQITYYCVTSAFQCVPFIGNNSNKHFLKSTEPI